MENIKEQQDADDALLQHATKNADRYMRKRICTVDDILCYDKPGDPPNNWKIALPRSLLQHTIMWFHQVTGHQGRKDYSCKSLVGSTTEIFALLLTNSIVNNVKETN
jgi:hypothetical protein